jgi:O-antigen/teichoic acid export membrane protein
LEQKALRGVPWTLLAYASNKAVTVGTTLVLARLLTPEDFGIVALALLVIVALSFLRDLGLNGALILRQDLDRRAKGTLLTLMLGTGALLGLALAAASPLVAELMDEPRLDEVTAALSATLLLGGVTWFYEALLQRELEFRKRFYSLAAQSLTNAAVALPLAALGAGVWSLVAGQLASTVAFGAALLAVAPYRVRPAFDRDAAVDALRTGRGFLLQAFGGFAQQNADYLVVGRVLGAAPLGYYSMAYRLAELPYYAIAEPVARVTFPAFARMRSRGEDIRPSFLSGLRLVALVTCPVGVILSGAAEPFTHAILGDAWLAMIGPLAVLGVWAAIRPLQVTVSWLLNSIGEAGLMGVVSVAVLVPLVPSLVLAAELGGMTAVAWVMVADIAVSLLVLGVFASRRGGVGLGAQWRASAPAVVACLPAWVAARAVADATVADLPAGVALLASAAAGTLAYVAAVFAMDPRLPATALHQIGRTLGREPATAAPLEREVGGATPVGGEPLA